MQPEDIDLRMAELHAAVVGDEPLDQVLAMVARLAVSAVPACRSSSASLVADRDGSPADAAASSAEPVLVLALADDDRWPAYGASKVAEGVVSVLAVPLRWDDRVIGALELCSHDEPFTSADLDRALRLAELAAVAVANAQEYRRTLDLVANLRSALGSRDLIGQAKGILMARHGLSSAQAFEVLRRRSQDDNIKLRNVAALVVDEAEATSGDPSAS